MNGDTALAQLLALALQQRDQHAQTIATLQAELRQARETTPPEMAVPPEGGGNGA